MLYITVMYTYPLLGPLGTIQGSTPPTMAQNRVTITIGTARPIFLISFTGSLMIMSHALLRMCDGNAQNIPSTKH